MRVWIDISNSPHPLLFAPVGRRLEQLGHEVVVTVRDHAQSVALAKERWPGVEIVGTESPRRHFEKLSSAARRARALRQWARCAKPQVALSHNSYPQIVAARSLGLPTITAMDYEHQPANHLAFRLATRILLPECLPLDRVRGQGAKGSKVVRYPGLKEEAYIGDFEPDANILEHLGVERDGHFIVVARTSPSGALYHQFENPLFTMALRRVCSNENARCIVLPRYAEQAAAIRRQALPNCVVPTTAVDSRSLMYYADMLLGAGGTMTREAALLGLRTYTLFAGRHSAVDESLIQRGLLTRLESSAQLDDLSPNRGHLRSVEQLRKSADPILEVFVTTICGYAA